MNIRDENHVKQLLNAGWIWVTCNPYGECKGNIYSKHKSYDNAHNYVKNLSIDIVDLNDAHMY